MLKVVIDVNIWVSTLIKPHGRYARMVEEITQKGELFTAEEILAKAREVAFRPRIKDKYKLDETSIDQALNEARGYATILSDLLEVTAVEEDPDDDVIVACALKAKAGYIVSYDPHLTDLKEYQGIQIVKPAEFLEILKSAQEPEQQDENDTST